MISVLMATYNGERYIEQQLESLINQTKKIDNIIIGDDCSTDETVSIIQEFIRKYDNIILYRNEINLGYTKNFFNLLQKINSGLIFLCDQDDVWDLNKIEVMTSLLVKNECMLLSSGYEIVDENLSLITRRKYDTLLKKVELSSFLHNCDYPGMTFCFTCDLLNTEEFKNIKDAAFIHDFFLSLIAIKYQSMFIVNRCLVKYRQHNNNALGVGGIKRKLKKDWMDNLNIKKKEVELGLLVFPENPFLKKKEIFTIKRLKYFNEGNVIAIFLSLINYFMYYNIKSWLGDLMYSFQKKD